MVKYERSSLSGGDGLDDNEVGDSLHQNSQEMEVKDKSPDGVVEFKNSTSYRPVTKKPRKWCSTLEKSLIVLCLLLLLVVLILAILYALPKGVGKLFLSYNFMAICDHPPRNRCKVAPGSFSVYVISRKHMSQALK